METEWKEVTKKGHKKQKVRKVHFAALTDIRHIIKYEYIPEIVRGSNLKCGHKYKYIPVNTVATNEKLRE